MMFRACRGLLLLVAFLFRAIQHHPITVVKAMNPARRSDVSPARRPSVSPADALEYATSEIAGGNCTRNGVALRPKLDMRRVLESALPRALFIGLVGAEFRNVALLDICDAVLIGRLPGKPVRGAP
jgi:hypothetical protein